MTDALAGPSSESSNAALEQGHTLDPLTTALAYRMILSFINEPDLQKAQRGLALLWAAHDETIDESAIKRVDALPILVLREYFSHRGDWQAMRDCVRRRLKYVSVEKLDKLKGPIAFWESVGSVPDSLCDVMNQCVEASNGQ